MKFPIMEQILQGVDSVSEADLERVKRTLDHKEKGEGFLAIIDNPSLVNLWALGFVYAGQAKQYENMAMFEARNDDESHQFKVESAKFKRMASICIELFWLEAACSVGPDALLAHGIGIRNGMELVSRKPKPDMPFPFPFPFKFPPDSEDA